MAPVPPPPPPPAAPESSSGSTRRRRSKSESNSSPLAEAMRLRRAAAGLAPEEDEFLDLAAPLPNPRPSRVARFVVNHDEPECHGEKWVDISMRPPMLESGEEEMDGDDRTTTALGRVLVCASLNCEGVEQRDARHRLEHLPSSLKQLEAQYGPLDFVTLQEVTAAVLELLMESDFVRSNFYVTPPNAEMFPPSSHGLVTLSRRRPIAACTIPLRSNGRRVAHVVECVVGGHSFVCGNVHLESPRQDHAIRANQLETVFDALFGPQKARWGYIAGDTNLHVWEAVELPSGIVDVWTHLYGEEEPGFTYDSVRNPRTDRAYKEAQGAAFVNQHRLDRFFLKGGGGGGGGGGETGNCELEALDMAIVLDGPYDDTEPEDRISDHFGVVLRMEIVGV